MEKVKSRVEETTTTANTKGPRSITEKLVPKSISYLQLLDGCCCCYTACLFLLASVSHDACLWIQHTDSDSQTQRWATTILWVGGYAEEEDDYGKAAGVGGWLVGVVYTKIVATTPTMNRIPTEDYRKITRKGNWNWMLLAEWRR